MRKGMVYGNEIIIKMTRLLLIFSLICIFTGSVFSQNTDPKKVLFVGNSYTYFWNLPQHVAAMAEDQGRPISTAQSTAGGVTWGQHWRGEKDLRTRNIIKEGDYDIVVIQNHSMRAINAPDSLMYYGKLLNELIKISGAQTMLYMTWSREWDPFMIKEINEKYQELGRVINAPVAPVGLVWDKALEMRPGLGLYDADGSHPSALGTYLISCVFYSILTRDSPVGISHRLIMKDENGEKLYLNIQSKEDALFCQKVVESVVNDYID